jgi:hypothetical protein
MKKKSNYRSVWDNTSQQEKERIFRIFLNKYGEDYAPEDFIEFLKNRYSVSTPPLTS